MNLDWRKSKVLTRLSGPGLFDWRLFWWTFFIYFFLQISLDVIAYDSPSWLWLPVWIAGHLLATAVAILFRVTFLDKSLAKNPNPFLNLAVAAILGIVRVVSIGWLSFELELQGVFDLGLRILSGFLLGVLTFAVLVTYFESQRGYLEASRQLQASSKRLRLLRKDTKESIKASQLEIQRTIQKIIEPRLSELANLLRREEIDESLRDEIFEETKDLLEEKVRPLTQSFKKSAEALEDPKVFTKVSRRYLFRLPSIVQPHLAIKPFQLLVILLATIPFVLYVYEGSDWILLGFFLAITTFALQAVARYLLGTLPPIRKQNGLIELIVISAIPIFFMVYSLSAADFPSKSLPAVASVFGMVYISTQVLTGLVVVQDFNRERYLKEVEKNNKRIERELALVSQQVWVERRDIALRLHGTVQASLSAALARLSAGSKLEKDELKKVREHIAQARRGIAPSERKEFNLEKSLKDIRSTWRGVIDVKLSLKTPSAEALAKDKWASIVANEIIKEGISNSALHGKANTAWVHCEIKVPGFIEIFVEDDGKGVSKKAEPGLGSDLLDEVAHDWWLKPREGGGSILRACIPLSKSVPA